VNIHGKVLLNNQNHVLNVKDMIGMKVEMMERQKVIRYLKNLNHDSLFDIAILLMIDEEAKKHIEFMAEEFDKMYSLK